MQKNTKIFRNEYNRFVECLSQIVCSIDWLIMASIRIEHLLIMQHFIHVQLYFIVILSVHFFPFSFFAVYQQYNQCAKHKQINVRLSIVHWEKREIENKLRNNEKATNQLAEYFGKKHSIGSDKVKMWLLNSVVHHILAIRQSTFVASFSVLADRIDCWAVQTREKKLSNCWQCNWNVRWNLIL